MTLPTNEAFSWSPRWRNLTIQFGNQSQYLISPIPPICNGMTLSIQSNDGLIVAQSQPFNLVARSLSISSPNPTSIIRFDQGINVAGSLMNGDVSDSPILDAYIELQCSYPSWSGMIYLGPQSLSDVVAGTASWYISTYVTPFIQTCTSGTLMNYTMYFVVGPELNVSVSGTGSYGPVAIGVTSLSLLPVSTGGTYPELWASSTYTLR